jgi:hypothetical protein
MTTTRQSLNAASFLFGSEKIAELESSLKVKRLERDIPKYLRAQD